jgi:hypothetical protein
VEVVEAVLSEGITAVGEIEAGELVVEDAAEDEVGALEDRILHFVLSARSNH